MRKLVKITGDYLLFPIREEEGLYSFHYYAAVPVREWKGEEIVVEGEVPESFMEAVALLNELPWILHKKPLIYFSPNTGWVNDPNGMIYRDGVYLWQLGKYFSCGA